MKQFGKLAGKAVIAAIIIAANASAATASVPATQSLEAIFGGDGTGIIALSDAQLAAARGGFGGISFSLTGYGNISTLTGGLPAGVEISSQSADLVSLNVGLASLPNTGGFIQFASIVGNNNVINNTLNLNVYILSGGVADTTGIINGSAFGL